MDLRQTTKAYLLNKVLRKAHLSKPHHLVLFALYLTGPAILQEISNQLTRSKHQTGHNYLIKYLKQLITLNLIIREKFIYTLTIKGLATLQDIETRIRKEYHYR